MGDKYRQLLKNTVFFGIGAFGTRFINFFLIPFYTNFLSTDHYGTADLILTTSTLLVLVMTVDIMDAVIPFVLDKKYKNESVLSISIKVVFVSVIILVLCLVLIGATGVLSVEPILLVFLFIIFTANSFNRLYNSYLQSINRVIDVSIANIIQTAITVLLNIYLIAVLKLGLYGYLISISVGFLASLVYEIIIVNRAFKWKFKLEKWNKDLAKSMTVFSFPLMLNSVFWWLNTSVDKYFIVVICGAAQNGVYTVATKIPTLLTVVLSVFTQAWGLSAVKEYDKYDRDGFFTKTYETFNAVICIMCSQIILLIIPFAKLLFAEAFFDAWKPALFLMLSGIFSSLSSFVGGIFSAVKDSRVYMKSTIIAAIVNMTFNIIFIKKIGILGASIATAISFIIVWIIRIRFSLRYVNWKLNFLKHIIEYCLIILQIFCSLSENHMYYIQSIILTSLIILNWKEIILVFNKIHQIITR